MTVINLQLIFKQSVTDFISLMIPGIHWAKIAAPMGSASSSAVCFLPAYANPIHELQTGEIINQVYPDATISLSHQLMREWREYEHTSTTVINAFIAPVVGCAKRRHAAVSQPPGNVSSQGHGRCRGWRNSIIGENIDGR